MLNFELEEQKKILKSDLLKMPLIDIIDDRRHFRVFIGDNLYFEDEYLPIREFVKYSLSWEKQIFKKDFIYNTIDDYQNPLLAFRRLKDGWKIQSVWQKFEFQQLFSKEEVVTFVKSILDYVIE